MKPKQFDVVVVGNVGIDTNVYLPGADIDFGVEANFTTNIDYVGHAGGYCARGFAQLGKRTAFVGYVGQDHNGQFIRQEFAHDGIDTTALFIDPSGSGRSINFMYQDGRRKNFYNGKGHMHLKPDLDICKNILAQSRLAHFSIPNWARYLLPEAKSLGLTIACDIQDVVSIDDPYRLEFIEYSDILFFSSVNYTNPTAIMKELLAANPNQIVISGMGDEGCALGTKDGIQFFRAVQMEAPVIDTNGAGDGLAVGFLASYILDGYSLAESVRRGQITARYTCTLQADSSNLITKNLLDNLYGKHKE